MACKDFSIYYMALHKQSLPTPDLDHSIGLESHRPLPFPPGTELILEEAFTTDCGNSEDGAFFLKRQKHTLWRERKGKGAGQQGPFCDTTLQWRLASGGKMSGWMRLSCVWILWLRRLWTDVQFSFRIRCWVSGPNLRQNRLCSQHPLGNTSFHLRSSTGE